MCLALLARTEESEMFEGLFQPLHLLVVLIVVLLVFGPKRLPEIGKALGESIRGFKKAFHEGETKTQAQTSSEKTPD